MLRTKNYRLKEYLCDVVVVCAELFNCRARIEAKQVYFVVHAGQRVRSSLSKRGRRGQSTLTNKKALFGCQVSHGVHLDEPVHGTGDQH